LTSGRSDGWDAPSGFQCLVSAALDVTEAVPAGELQGSADQGLCAFVVAVEKKLAPVECGFGGAER